MKNITQLIKNKILFALKNNKNDINKSDIIKNSLKYYFLLSKLNKKKINVVECGIGAGESLSYICKISKLLDIEAIYGHSTLLKDFLNLLLKMKENIKQET